MSAPSQKNSEPRLVKTLRLLLSSTDTCYRQLLCRYATPRIYAWLLALLVPIFAIYPALVYAIEEHSYDAAAFHVYRGVIFSAARTEGVFYPRWVQTINGGLGGPLFEFYSPLTYFLMDVLNWVGIPHPLSWRLLTVIFLLAAALGMFRLGLALFKRADAALLAETIFVYNPYLLRDLYERGTPQGLALSLLPLMLWLLYCSSENFTALRVTLAALCFAAMILLHNATALLVMPVILIFVLAFPHTPRMFALPFWVRVRVGASISLLAGLALAAFYLIPYVAEIQYIQFDNLYRAEYAMPANNPLRLGDLLSAPRLMDTGLGNNSFGEGGGLFHVSSLLLSIPVGLWFYRAKKCAELFLVIGNLLLVLGALTMQLDSATWVWQALPELNAFQFRWRLLAPLAFVSALVVGYFFMQWQSRARAWTLRLLITVYCSLSFFSLYPNLLFRYNQFAPRPTVAQAQAYALDARAPGLTGYDELLPRWRESPITNYVTTPISNLPDDARVISESHRNGLLQTQIETPRDFTAEMNVLYFPGWVATLDGRAANIAPSAPGGLITLEVAAGTHTLELWYVGTNAQRAGDLVSIVTMIALVAFSVWDNARNKIPPSPLNAREVGGIAFFLPHWWIPPAIIFVAIIKASWVDSQTTWLRASSKCNAIQDAVAQTNVTFDDRVRMCGYALTRNELQANDELRITIYWQIDSPALENDFSFVHLLGENFNPETGNPLWGQQDKQTPGEHALTTWVAGKLYRDVYVFRVAPHIPPGAYQLEIGWQDANGKRLTPRAIARGKDMAVSNLDALLISGLVVK